MGEVCRGIGAERHRPFRRAWLAGLLLLGCSGLAEASPGDTELLSVTSADAAAAGDSFEPVVSADGRYVVFQSYATSIAPADTRRNSEIFLRDRQAGSTVRVSVAANGEAANLTSWTPAISANGHVVAFVSNSSNLIPGRSRSAWALYVRDLDMRSTEVLSATAGGNIVNASEPSLSADGRYLAFTSADSKLVAGDTNATSDVYVRDRQTGTLELVSRSTGGTPGNSPSGQPSISADGRYVAFVSYASDLVAGDRNDDADVFVYDRQAGMVSRVSVGSAGEGRGPSGAPSISADGRYVAFESLAALVAEDDDWNWDVYVRDRVAAGTERVSLDHQGRPSSGDQHGASISADGRFVAFVSNAALVPGGFGGAFVRDRVLGLTLRASVDGHGGPAGIVGKASISGDGSTVVFDTDTNLARVDANYAIGPEAYDIYAHELGAVRTPQIAFSIHPDTLAFGAQPVGSARTLSFWLHNRSESALPVVDMHLAGADHAEFARSRDCHFVQPGDSCRIRVTFRPESAGPKSAVLQVVAGVDTQRARTVTGEGT